MQMMAVVVVDHHIGNCPIEVCPQIPVPKRLQVQYDQTKHCCSRGVFQYLFVQGSFAVLVNEIGRKIMDFTDFNHMVPKVSLGQRGVVHHRIHVVEDRIVHVGRWVGGIEDQNFDLWDGEPPTCHEGTNVVGGHVLVRHGSFSEGFVLADNVHVHFLGCWHGGLPMANGDGEMRGRWWGLVCTFVLATFGSSAFSHGVLVGCPRMVVLKLFLYSSDMNENFNFYG
jgi:hypothetical protein